MRDAADLGQPQPLADSEGGVAELEVGIVAPQVQGVIQISQYVLRPPGFSVSHQVLETKRVNAGDLGVEAVTSRVGTDHATVAAQIGTQPNHVTLQRLRGRTRRRWAPQILDQHRRRHRTPCAADQSREQPTP